MPRVRLGTLRVAVQPCSPDILSCESRSPSTIDVSDSLFALSLPRLFLSGLPMQHVASEHIGPLLSSIRYSPYIPRPFTPEDPSEPHRILCRNGSVGVEFSTVENFLILINAFSGLHTASGVTSPCGLQSSLCTLLPLRSSCQYWAIRSSGRVLIRDTYAKATLGTGGWLILSR